MLELILSLLLQVFMYGLFIWITWIVISFFLSVYAGENGIFLGHIIVAIMIIYIDIHWIQEEMSQPNWKGQPDMDIVFCIGLTIRIVIVNSLLFGISILGSRFRDKK